MRITLAHIPIRQPEDVRTLCRRTCEIAELAGVDSLDQLRLTTAAGEIARNVLQHASGGEAELLLDAGMLTIAITDQGPGMPSAESAAGFGISAAAKLLDHFEIRNGDSGCTAVLSKRLPAPVSDDLASQFAAKLEDEAQTHVDHLRAENLLRMRLIEEFTARQREVARVTTELEDTNRGVLALYAELDEKAERLRRADEMKSRFLSHMSHEFRTPLTSIMALSRLLLDETDGRLTPEQQKQASFIRKSAESLLDMVNDLLDLARVEAGKSIVRASRFEIANVFGALRSLLRPLQNNAAVELVFEDASQLPPLNTDEAKVTQILRNFISNALKFTENGEVRVSAKLGPNRDTVIFSVADTGIGIAPTHQALIFRDFSQIENPLQHKVKGTGLGLSLSKGLAELLGGKVTLESVPGKGSTFSAEIPIVYGGGAGAAAGSVPDVLLIDDEEVSRYITRQALGSGVYVTEASDGASGVVLARQHHPRAVLLDLNMQPMDGFEVLDQLKRDPSTREIPVVILTAKTLTPGERDILGSRVAACLSKEVLSQPDAGDKLRSAIGVRQPPRPLAQ